MTEEHLSLGDCSGSCLSPTGILIDHVHSCETPQQLNLTFHAKLAGLRANHNSTAPKSVTSLVLTIQAKTSHSFLCKLSYVHLKCHSGIKCYYFLKKTSSWWLSHPCEEKHSNPKFFPPTVQLNLLSVPCTLISQISLMENMYLCFIIK